MEEYWAPVPGNWRWAYEVSDQGRVRNTTKGTLLKLTNSDDYLTCSLASRDRARRNFRIHRLVLEAFVGPCPDGMEGCHNNGDPADNRLENLRWGTPRENAADARKHQGKFQRNVKLTVDQVHAIRRRAHESSSVLALEYGVTRDNVRAIIRRVNWKHV